MMRRLLWQGAMTALGVRAVWRERAAYEALTPERRRAYVADRMRAQVARAAQLPDSPPEWGDAARTRDNDELWAAWSSLPILGKDDLRTRFSPARLRATGLSGWSSSTGGSTGEPTPFLHDAVTQTRVRAAGLYCRLRFGWRPGMPVISVWGSERDIGKQRTLRGRAGAFLRNMWLVDGYSLDDGTARTVLDLIERHHPVALYGFTSMLEFVARRVVQLGVRVPRGHVRTGWNGGEMLSPPQSELFEQAFGVPILNFYAGRELGAMAYQPAAGLPLRVLQPWLHLDIVQPDGTPAPPGVPGRLVWTALRGGGTPFIRYDTGDLGVYAAGDVDASGIHAIAELHGRTAGLLTLSNGRTINCLYWNHLMKEFPEVDQFQVAAQDPARLELRLRGRGFSPEREAQLQQVVRTFLGAGIELHIVWLERIPLTSQGKLLQVVRA